MPFVGEGAKLNNKERLEFLGSKRDVNPYVLYNEDKSWSKTKKINHMRKIKEITAKIDKIVDLYVKVKRLSESDYWGLRTWLKSLVDRKTDMQLGVSDSAVGDAAWEMIKLKREKNGKKMRA
jgi:hypothetical protein